MYSRIKGKSPQRKPKRSRKEIAFVLFIAAIVLILFFAKNIFYGTLSSQWPTTTGTVDAHDITVATKRRGGREYYTYRANIYYTYRVNDQIYRDDRVTFPYFIEGSPEALKPYFASYPVGTEVTVHYNPLHPETAILIPVVSGLTEYAAIGMILLLLLLGVLLWQDS